MDAPKKMEDLENGTKKLALDPLSQFPKKTLGEKLPSILKVEVDPPFQFKKNRQASRQVLAIDQSNAMGDDLCSSASGLAEEPAAKPCHRH